jgi:hypothetical protein
MTPGGIETATNWHKNKKKPNSDVPQNNPSKTHQ